MTSDFKTFVKSPKVLITGALLVAFAAGAALVSLTKRGSTNAAFDPAMTPATSVTVPNPNAPVPGNMTAPVSTAAPASAPAPVRSVRSAPRTVRHKRSWQKEALIIGGSSAAGAAIGGVAAGGKGAAIGALSGGAAGTIYDLTTRNK